MAKSANRKSTNPRDGSRKCFPDVLQYSEIQWAASDNLSASKLRPRKIIGYIIVRRLRHHSLPLSS